MWKRVFWRQTIIYRYNHTSCHLSHIVTDITVAIDIAYDPAPTVKEQKYLLFIYSRCIRRQKKPYRNFIINSGNFMIPYRISRLQIWTYGIIYLAMYFIVFLYIQIRI